MDWEEIQQHWFPGKPREQFIIHRQGLSRQGHPGCIICEKMKERQEMLIRFIPGSSHRQDPGPDGEELWVALPPAEGQRILLKAWEEFSEIRDPELQNWEISQWIEREVSCGRSARMRMQEVKARQRRTHVPVDKVR